jgi:hypothetical protein
MADMETAGETPQATDTVTPTPEQGETPDPGTSPAEHEPEPAETEGETPAEAEPVEDPAAPLKKALESERESRKVAEKELKELRTELLRRDTLDLVRHYNLNDRQREYIESIPTLELREKAAKAVGELKPSGSIPWGGGQRNNGPNFKRPGKPISSIPLMRPPRPSPLGFDSEITVNMSRVKSKNKD